MSRILIVDDEKSIRIVLSRHLEAAGHEVQLAESSAEARRIIGQTPFDLIITDILLPDSSGVEILKHVREMGFESKVIMITGQPTLDSATEALRADAFDYLTKPITREIIMRSVSRALHVKNLEEENRSYRDRLESLVEERTNKLRESTEQLQHSQMRYLAVLRSTSHGLCILTSNWVIEYANHAMHQILDPSSQRTDNLIGVPFKSFFLDEARFDAYSKSALSTMRMEGIDQRDIEVKCLDGTPRWCEISVVRHNPAETAGGFVATVTDITERKKAEEQLRFDALHDALTRLPNRNLFLDRLQQAINKKRRNTDLKFAVLFLDLDDFKKVNDSLGHAIGDNLLIEISRRIRSCLRDTDTVARLGGDEFAILTEDLDSRNMVIEITRRLITEITKPYFLSDHQVYISPSIGIADGESRAQTALEYLRDADTAMYEAKKQGKNRYAFFEPSMHEAAIHRIRIEEEFQHALWHTQFAAYYQPIVRLDDGSLEGFEALLRWQHPEKGMISPAVFIPLAEQTGLIVQIGEWILEKALRQASIWTERYHRKVSMHVNVAARQMAESSFRENVLRTIQASGLDPSQVHLELTESALIEHSASADTLSAFKSAGIHLCLDDFGTGYSSLSYLHRFPIDVIKIDRSFVSRMNEQTSALEIVRAVKALASSFHLRVVAEGVETAEQGARLTEIGCELAQGFYYGRPVPADEIEKMIKDGKLKV